MKSIYENTWAVAAAALMGRSDKFRVVSGRLNGGLTPLSGVYNSRDSLYDSLVTAYLEAEQLSLENFFLPQVPCLFPQFRMT